VHCPTCQTDRIDPQVALAAYRVQRFGIDSEPVRMLWTPTTDAVLRAGATADLTRPVGLLADHPRGLIPPFLRAELARGRGLLAEKLRALGARPALVRAEALAHVDRVPADA
jgi:hypothetical protein